MRRKIKFSEGEYYHIYNRGVDKRDIFIDKYDYDRFTLLLSICNSRLPIDIREVKNSPSEGPSFGKETIVSIGLWCLMPNHFHILIKEKVEGGISLFMKKLLTSYSMYFNKKYERSGALFQGRFQAQHANTDNYLKYLYSYIHLNPIKLIQADWKDVGINDLNRAQQFLSDYKYSSYLDYSELNRPKNYILDKNTFPEYFESVDSFKENIFDWLKYNPDKLEGLG